MKIQAQIQTQIQIQIQTGIQKKTDTNTKTVPTLAAPALSHFNHQSTITRLKYILKN